MSSPSHSLSVCTASSAQPCSLTLALHPHSTSLHRLPLSTTTIPMVYSLQHEEATRPFNRRRRTSLDAVVQPHQIRQAGYSPWHGKVEPASPRLLYPPHLRFGPFLSPSPSTSTVAGPPVRTSTVAVSNTWITHSSGGTRRQTPRHMPWYHTRSHASCLTRSMSPTRIRSGVTHWCTGISLLSSSPSRQHHLLANTTLSSPHRHPHHPHITTHPHTFPTV